MSSITNALQVLQQQFAASLSERLDALDAQYRKLSLSGWDPADVRVLHHQIHSLIGSAGTFGMQSLSTAARRVETRLKIIVDDGGPPSEAAWSDVGSELLRLDQLANSLLHARGPSLSAPPVPQGRNAEPRVYLVEDDVEQAEYLARTLRDDGFLVDVFVGLVAFRAALQDADMPDAVILDMIFPEGDEAGIEMLEELRAGREHCPPAVVVSVRDDLDARLAAYRAGASRYLLKPARPTTVIDLLDELTGRMPPEPYRVLLVDDDPMLLEAQAAVLRAAGMTVEALVQPRHTLAALDSFRPDVMVLDVHMPEISGPELASIVRERDDNLSLPILFLSAETDMSQQLLALNLGGDDFLVKPVEAGHLVSAVTARARRSRQNAAVQNRLKTTLYEREREHHAVNHHAIVSIADVAGEIIYVNDLFCQVSGYSRDELLGQNHRIVKSEEHPPEFYREMWRTISRGEVWQGEICNRGKDGSLYWVESTITPFLNELGKPYQYVSIRTDITDQRRAEQAAEQAKERLRRGQIYSNIGTWEWNIVTGELYWTERIAPLFGYPRGDLETSYENFLGAVHPDDRQAVIDAVSACIEHDAPYDIEHRVVWPDGTVRWLLERGAVQRDADGNPRSMLGVVQDIDDRKRAEVDLAERERQLLEAQSLASIGNWRADLTTGELLWSDEIYRIFGYEPRSFAPSVEAFHAAVHPEDREAVHRSEKRAEKTGRHDIVHRILRPDGSVRYVHELAQLHLDQSGKPVGLMTGTVQDVTERVEFEQALVAAREEADRANQAKSEFLSSMSHELRTPMNAILGFGQLMEYDDTLPDEHRDSVDEILKAGNHLLELISEVLDLAKVESGSIDLSIEPVEVCSVVEECLALIHPLAAKRSIRLSHQGLEGMAVRADRMRLKQVLLNLLSNAIKYNRDGGSVRLEVLYAGEDRLCIQVVDSGKGIPADKLADLFEPFNRVGAEAGETEGTGIGLTITRRIVEMMGGSVDVKSEVGVGSTFWIELPLETLAETGQLPVGTEDGGHASVAADGQVEHTVLYIEDNPSNIKLIAQLLGRIPHINLFTAHTPELGIELALARQPDLILLDINMPGMDGYEVLEVLQAETSLKNVPVIAITANAMPRDVQRGQAAGFADYLTKPLDVAKFLETVNHNLAGESA
ncbi:response regulator [Guyparkeria sp. 1SP6A2]|nr:response regulator [Guyparkeria sp. 1SP6A2]